MKIGSVKLIYSFFIVVLYFVFGILLLYKYLVWQEVPNLSLAGVGVLVILYGVFRGYRSFREIRESEGNEKENEKL